MNANICRFNARPQAVLLAYHGQLWKQPSHRDQIGVDGSGLAAFCPVRAPYKDVWT